MKPKIPTIQYYEKRNFPAFSVYVLATGFSQRLSKQLGRSRISTLSLLLRDAASGKFLYQKNPWRIRKSVIWLLLSLLIIYDALDQEKIHLDDRNPIYEANALSQNYEEWMCR